MGPTQPSRHGYGGSFPGVKRSGREVDLSPLCSAKVKSEWSYTSVPRIFLHEVYRDNFTLISKTVTLTEIRDESKICISSQPKKVLFFVNV